MNRADFQRLARLRLREARVLLKNGLPDGAYYLGGYALECALKAVIARSTQRFDFPEKKRVDDSHTHDLGKLMTIANLRPAFELERSSDPNLDADWRVVERWNERARYEVGRTPKEAQELLKSIKDRHRGVMRWIETHW
jgi:HEPN domain-containing protein